LIIRIEKFNPSAILDRARDCPAKGIVYFGGCESVDVSRLQMWYPLAMKWWQNHLPTCGTAYRGCDPQCPKELEEQRLDALPDKQNRQPKILEARDTSDYPDDAEHHEK